MLFNKLNSSKKKCLNKIYSYKINYSGGSTYKDIVMGTNNASSNNSNNSSTNTKIDIDEFIYDFNHFYTNVMNNNKIFLDGDIKDINNLNVTNEIKIDINYNNWNLESDLRIVNNILIIKDSLLKELNNKEVPFYNFAQFLNDLYIKNIDHIFIIYIAKDENNEINEINKNEENIDENKNLDSKVEDDDQKETKKNEFSEGGIDDITTNNLFENIDFCNILIYNNEIHIKNFNLDKTESNEDYIKEIIKRLEDLNLDLKLAKSNEPELNSNFMSIMDENTKK
jgi:hypothetical protein